MWWLNENTSTKHGRQLQIQREAADSRRLCVRMSEGGVRLICSCVSWSFGLCLQNVTGHWFTVTLTSLTVPAGRDSRSRCSHVTDARSGKLPVLTMLTVQPALSQGALALLLRVADSLASHQPAALMWNTSFTHKVIFSHFHFIPVQNLVRFLGLFYESGWFEPVGKLSHSLFLGNQRQNWSCDHTLDRERSRE